MPSTMLLDVSAWDLVLDADNNIAAASEPYSLAQDAASAIKTFLGEVYWDTSIGIPYLTQVLGRRPNMTLLKSQMVAAAETVPDVAKAVCIISGLVDRRLSGQVQVIAKSDGQSSLATFTVLDPQGV